MKSDSDGAGNQIKYRCAYARVQALKCYHTNCYPLLKSQSSMWLCFYGAPVTLATGWCGVRSHTEPGEG